MKPVQTFAATKYKLNHTKQAWSQLKQTGVEFPIEIFNGCNFTWLGRLGSWRNPQDSAMRRVPRTTLVTAHKTSFWITKSRLSTNDWNNPRNRTDLHSQQTWPTTWTVHSRKLTSLRGTVKWVSAFGLSNNNKWRWWVWLLAAYRWTDSPGHLAWSEGRRLLSAIPYSSHEPGELSQWLWATMTAP